jgi:DNA primase large subunit
MMDDPAVYARYPFLRGARKIVEGLNLSFQDMVGHPVYSFALELGRHRVIECAQRRFSPDMSRNPELIILSYPVARMLAESMGHNLRLRHAVGEAQAAYEMFQAEDKGLLDEIMSDLGVEIDGGHMRVLDYIRLSGGLSRDSPRWKLTNRTLSRGLVEVGQGDVLLLLRQAVVERVLEAVDLRRVPKEVVEAGVNLRKTLSDWEDVSVDELEGNALPPCVKSMMGEMENASAGHHAMFILASFLANLGLDTDSIISIYRKSPRFDEEKARYQLGYITGEAGGTKYSCPACATIKSHGLCRWDCNVKHPLQYYRNNAGRKSDAHIKRAAK